jgi:non-specific serine/threonine protein kinase/serine/threonine-protein kinase
MEYVAGIPINDYCDQHRLTVPQRLQLFKQVCEGVQHAHQKSIVHRDLKPSNILVTEVDGKPLPRIIDFGIAKTISIGPREMETLFTQAGALVGTPGFMSPEQLDPKNADIDTRTDVYSLGVLLYTLLTGTMPFSGVQWNKKPIDEILRELREEEPPSPSTRVASSEGTTLEAAGLRRTDPQQLASTLRGDLDWITMKAMEKDRERRYASPADLALDLQRYLENRPVLARQPSLGYRLRKYVARNRILATAVALGTVMVITFIGLQAVQLRRTTRERDRANRITEFMTRMFEVADPNEARGNTITVREVLDKASKDIESQLSNDPQLQAQMMSVMGDVYHRLGLLTKAETLLNKSMETERRVLAPDDSEAASTTSRLASTMADEGKLADAEKLLRPLVEVEKRKLGPENQKTLVCENLLATTLHGQGKFADAVKMYREVLETQRRVYGPDDPITLTLMSNIAAALADSGSHSPEIEKLDNQVLESRRRTLGPDHPDTLRSMANLGIVLTSQGNRAVEAEKLLQDTLDRQKQILGPEHPDTLGTMGALTSVYELEYRYADEEKLVRETLAIEQRVLGPEHGDTIAALANLGGCLGLQKRYSQAEEVSRRAIEIEKRALPPEHPTTLQTKANLADILEAERHLSEADQLVREVLDTDQRVLGPDNPMTIQAVYILGKIQKDQGKLNDAEKTLSQGRATASRALPPDDPRTALYTYALAQNAAIRGNRTAALALLREALDHGLDPPTTVEIEKDADFKSLHGDPNFRAILVRTQERASATAPKSGTSSK